MKRFITLFLVMTFYTISWGMDNTSDEYTYDEFKKHYIFGTLEKISIVVSYSFKQNGSKNLFRVHSKKSYPDGAISNRSFEWEEPRVISRGFPDAYEQWNAMKRKLSSITREDDKKSLKVAMENIVVPKMKPYMSREDMFRVLGSLIDDSKDDKPRQPLR